MAAMRHILSFASALALLGMPAAAPAATDIEARLATIGAEITRLADERQIERVQRAYGYYVDKAMWDNLADLFSDDATLEIGGRGVFVSKAHILRYMREGLGPDGPRPNFVMDHEQLQGVITVAPDGKTAKARWRAFVVGMGKTAVIGIVTYENQYVKQDGVWKISKLQAPFDMYTEYSKGWATSAIPNTRPSSFPPPPDRPPSVVYETYPSIYIPPYHYPNPVTGK